MAKWKLPADLHSKIDNGPLCFFHEHSIGSWDGLVPRYSDSHACVRCVSALTEGRLTLDIHKIHRKHRRKFLEFWSLVDIRSPDECWEWQGSSHTHWSSGYFHVARHWTRCNTHAANRVATWYTWGDVGRLPVEPICKNSNCCNPLHLRVKGVPHFYHKRKLQSINLEFNSMTLLRQTQEFLEASFNHAPKRFEALEKINADWIEYRLLGDGTAEESEPEHLDVDDDGHPRLVTDLLA